MACKNLFSKCKSLNCRVISHAANQDYCISCKKILKAIGEKMTECKSCSKNFHACFSCGLIYEWEYNYCSTACWESSQEYKQIKEYVDTWTQEELEEFKKYDIDLLKSMLLVRFGILKNGPAKSINSKAAKTIKVKKE